MISSPFVTPRQLIPRWRSIAGAVAENELIMPKREAAPALAPELFARLGSWRRDKNTVTAAEVFESAVIAGEEDLAVEAARFLARKIHDGLADVA